MFLDNGNYNLGILLIIPCTIENMAQIIYRTITFFGKTKIICLIMCFMYSAL